MRRFIIALAIIALIIITLVIVRYNHSPQKAINTYHTIYDRLPEPDDPNIDAYLKKVAHQVVPYINTSPQARILAQRLHAEHNVDLWDHIPIHTVEDVDEIDYGIGVALAEIYEEQQIANDHQPKSYDVPAPIKEVTVSSDHQVNLPQTTKKVEAEIDYFINDKQSTHDSAVSVTFHHNINNILNSIHHQLSPEETALNDIRKWAGDSSRALSVLQKMEAFNGTVSTGTHKNPITEIDLLRAIHARIMEPVNNKQRPELIKSLVDQLEYSFDKTSGRPVCSTGRTRNVLDALAQIDAEPDIVKTQTSAQIKEMLMNQMGKIMEDLDEDEPNNVSEYLTEKKRAVNTEYAAYLEVPSIKKFIDDAFNELQELIAMPD